MCELSLINLSYCNNLEKLPTSVGKLKKVKTLLLDGCDLHEPPVEMRGMDSQEMVRAINSKEFSCEAIPSKLKFLATSLPSLLVRLSLANNNLSNESFPTDLSCLSMLKELNLDGNPILSMPACVRSLPRLEELFMNDSGMLVSVEHPPCTLEALFLTEDNVTNWRGSDSDSSLRKICINLGRLKLKACSKPKICLAIMIIYYVVWPGLSPKIDQGDDKVIILRFIMNLEYSAHLIGGKQYQIGLGIETRGQQYRLQSLYLVKSSED